jgi:hypothetical protein
MDDAPESKLTCDEGGAGDKLGGCPVAPTKMHPFFAG